METLEEKIKILENELVEVKEQLKKEKEKINKRWKPELYNLYYFMGSDGDIYRSYWKNDKIDNWRYLNSNVFETEQEAEEHKKEKLEIQARFRNFVEERSEELDWNDYNQSKWYMYYNHYRKEIMFLDETFNKNQGTIYASSEQILIDAVEEIGENNVIKYVLEV